MAGRKHLADSLQTLHNLSMLLYCISIGSQQGLWPVHGFPKGKDCWPCDLEGGQSALLWKQVLTASTPSPDLPSAWSHHALNLTSPARSRELSGVLHLMSPFWLRSSPHLWWIGKVFIALYFLILCMVEKIPKEWTRERGGLGMWGGNIIHNALRLKFEAGVGEWECNGNIFPSVL